MWSITRGLLYLYFSAVVGFVATDLTLLGLARSYGGNTHLPGGGWPLAVLWPALILACFVSTQAGHFGRRVSVVKWTFLCLAATFAFAAFAVLSL